MDMDILCEFIYIYIYIYILDSHMAPYGACEVAQSTARSNAQGWGVGKTFWSTKHRFIVWIIIIITIIIHRRGKILFYATVCIFPGVLHKTVIAIISVFVRWMNTCMIKEYVL